MPGQRDGLQGRENPSRRVCMGGLCLSDRLQLDSCNAMRLARRSPQRMVQQSMFRVVGCRPVKHAAGQQQTGCNGG